MVTAEILKLFVSNSSIDTPPASDIIAMLRNEGFEVDHSPRNPSDGKDDRWYSWYSEGLESALIASDVVVIVVDAGWDSSTWMADEAYRARRLHQERSIDAVFVLNPLSISVHEGAMLDYFNQAEHVSTESLVESIRMLENPLENPPNLP